MDGGWRDCHSRRNTWDAAAPAKKYLMHLSKKGIPSSFGRKLFSAPYSRGWLVWVKPERGFSLSEAELAWTNISMPTRVYECRRSDPDRRSTIQPKNPRSYAMVHWKLDQFRRLCLRPLHGRPARAQIEPLPTQSFEPPREDEPAPQSAGPEALPALEPAAPQPAPPAAAPPRPGLASQPVLLFAAFLLLALVGLSLLWWYTANDGENQVAAFRTLPAHATPGISFQWSLK